MIRTDIDGVGFDAPEVCSCFRCPNTQPADFKRSYYGLPAGWEAWSSRAYREGVVCGPCVAATIDDVLDALRTAPEDFTWQPGVPRDDGIDW